MSSEHLPLTTGQEALWFLHRMAPTSPAYNVAMAVRIHQRVDDQALRRAVQRVLERHELLRSRFTEVDGTPYRVVHRGPIEVLELHELPGAADTELHERAHAAVNRPFDLTAPGPIRVLLLRPSPSDAVLLVVAHHLATDGASQVIVLGDLLTAYRAELDGTEPNWPELRRPFQELVDAEEELLTSPRRAELADYWREVCSGAPPVLELPVDHQRPARKRYAGASHDLRLPEELVQRLRPAAAAAAVTPFAVLFGTFQALLHRWTTQADFLVGYAVTTRPERTMKDAVGYFVNTLPHRVRIGRQLTFRQLFGAIGEQVRQDLAHRDFPLPLLPGELGLAADPGRTPVFQAMFSLVAANRFQPLLELLALGDPGAELIHHELRLSGFAVPQQEGQFDLSAEVLAGTGGVKVALKYDADLFEPATVARMAAHYERLLAAALADPDTPVAAVDLVDPAEREALLAFATGQW
ncbi:peptide synthetase [Streptomyces tateyamensis]|uniref:Peptide synthetase n=1 Tax=Streptomyces tateyamensis TaxID=565073 RepID=A0A2V4PMG2_9ACTN|nr:condensation domain-containing protein [Streptomyces tateyamensis]PYC87365.1 peptide synthetase [Streptomyces tateyamensis]